MRGIRTDGIRSLDDLRERCVIDEITGCWHWRGAFQEGRPRLRYWLGDVMRSCQYGRRGAIELRDGAPMQKGLVAFSKSTCNSIDCVNPDHARTGTKKEWGAALKKRGEFSSPHLAASARIRARARRKLTPEQVTYIRTADKPGTQLALEVGVSHSVVYDIRNGKRYRETLPAASVFSWRPAA